MPRRYQGQPIKPQPNPQARTRSSERGPAQKKNSECRDLVVVEQSQHEMATCFLQFCAMCERQIMTPCNSLLYCSEACRRKDSCKPLTAANLPQSSSSSLNSHPTCTSSPSASSSSSSRRTTSPPPRSAVYSPSRKGLNHQDSPLPRIPSDLHDFRSDLDPTEWKPHLSRRVTTAGPSLQRYEAHRSFSQFQRVMTTPTSASVNVTSRKNDTPVVSYQANSSMSSVAAFSPGNTMSTTSTAAPSLSSSPTMTTTSVSSVSSISTSTDLLVGGGREESEDGHAVGSDVGLPGSSNGYGYSGYKRPLPPPARQSGWFCPGSLGFTSDTVDLVTPQIPSSADTQIAHGSSGGGAGLSSARWRLRA